MTDQIQQGNTRSADELDLRDRRQRWVGFLWSLLLLLCILSDETTAFYALPVLIIPAWYIGRKIAEFDFWLYKKLWG